MKYIVKILALFALLCSSIVFIAGCECEHEYMEATCISGRVCQKCGNIEGEPVSNGGHKWIDATCLVAEKCELCGDMRGSKLGHDWIDATCQSPMKCTRCDATKGDVKEHLWINATCETPKTCDYCGQISGEELGHDWVEATCLEPKFCNRCSKTSGDSLGHDLVAPTCTAGISCQRCKIETGNPLGHDYYGGVCNRCGIWDEKFFVISNSRATRYVLGVETAEIWMVHWEYSVDGNDLIVFFDIRKTKDILGANHNDSYHVTWKLRNSKGVVIKSGKIYTESLKKNEYDNGFEITINGIDLGERYEFFLVSDSLVPR